jgi:leucyl/phenylalanyl-tRNA--protein transferase
MSYFEFPDPRNASPEGIVAIGGDLNTETLLRAYSQGIFPWPIEEGKPIIWASPAMRGIIEFEELHIPRSLRKEREKTRLTFTIDKDFPSIIHHCARTARPDQPGTWITSAMENAYNRLHELGYTHSVEVWDGDELVGGLYGIDEGGVFAGESMFHRRPNASKFALLHLIDHLKSRGAEWIDIQVLTPHMQILGAKEIPRDEFLQKLAAARARGLELFDETPAHESL